MTEQCRPQLPDASQETCRRRFAGSEAEEYADQEACRRQFAGSEAEEDADNEEGAAQSERQPWAHQRQLCFQERKRSGRRGYAGAGRCGLSEYDDLRDGVVVSMLLLTGVDKCC